MRSLSALLLAALLASTGCASAVRHPAAAIGITAGVLAGGMCEMATDGEHATCGIATAGAGLGLAGIVALAMLLGGEGNTVLNAPDEDEQHVPQDPTLDQPAPVPAPAPAPSPAAEPAPTWTQPASPVSAPPPDTAPPVAPAP